VRADRLRIHLEPELPGAPSPAELARSKGAVAQATASRVWRAGGLPSTYWGWVARQRQHAWATSRGDAPRSFVVAAGLGVRSALSPSDRAALRRAGLGHLVAVSGLHVGLAAWTLLAASMRLGARLGIGTWGVALSWVPLWGYVVLTGASPPAVRAAVMAMGVGLGGGLGRPHHGPVLLAITSVGMLVVQPAWAFDPGFQLSVAAMATLTRAPTGEGMLRQTWRVTWVVLPFSLWHFGQAGAWGIVANLVAVPVFTLWVLPLGLLGWLVVPWLGADALTPAGWGARPILELARVLADWPSPSTLVLGSAAGLAIVLGLIIGRRDRSGRLRPGWHWVPPLPVAVLVLVVIVWPRPTTAPAGPLWVFGSPSAPAVVTRAPGASIACIHAVAVSPSRWVPLLDAMGVSAAGWAHPGPRAPHEQALQHALQARGRWVSEPGGCPDAPSPSAARGVLEHCRRHASTRHAMAVVDQGAIDCFVHGRWRRIGGIELLDSPEPEDL